MISTPWSHLGPRKKREKGLEGRTPSSSAVFRSARFARFTHGTFARTWKFPCRTCSRRAAGRPTCRRCHNLQIQCVTETEWEPTRVRIQSLVHVFCVKRPNCSIDGTIKNRKKGWSDPFGIRNIPFLRIECGMLPRVETGHRATEWEWTLPYLGSFLNVLSISWLFIWLADTSASSLCFRQEAACLTSNTWWK